jgi:hypothetical protein
MKSTEVAQILKLLFSHNNNYATFFYKIGFGCIYGRIFFTNFLVTLSVDSFVASIFVLGFCFLAARGNDEQMFNHT